MVQTSNIPTRGAHVHELAKSASWGDGDGLTYDICTSAVGIFDICVGSLHTHKYTTPNIQTTAIVQGADAAFSQHFGR